MKELDIYTDCSGSLNDFGISIVVIDNDEESIQNYKTNTESLNHEFKTLDECGSTTIGELYAIYKSLSNLMVKKEIKNHIKIYTDNESIFMLLNGVSKLRNWKKNKDNDSLLHILYSRCMRVLNEHKNIEVLFIKSHIGIYGNEVANIYAQSIRNDGLEYKKGKKKYNVPPLDRVNSFISIFKKLS